LKKIFLFTFFAGCFFLSKAQKVDSIFFNLYTDSLKKGSWNYINVDAKLSNGKYMPLTAKDVNFTVSAGKLEDNSIWIDWNFKPDSVVVSIQLKKDPSVTRTVTIWIKKYDEQLNYQSPFKQDSSFKQTPTKPSGKSSRRKKKS
jgi:hypothetical protein